MTGSSRAPGLAIALLAGTFLAWAGPALALTPGELDERIAEIEEVHVTRPWPESQRMIDALRPELDDATASQRARVDIMEARNLILDGRYQPALDLLDGVLKGQISNARRLRALELAINSNYVSQNYERAFDLLGRALALFPRTNDVVRKTSILTLAARLHSDVGEDSLAVEYAAESLDLARQTDNLRTIYNSLWSLVLVQKNAGLVQFALDGTEELWELSQQSEDPVFVGTALGLIGSTHNAAGEYREAIGWLRRAIEKNRETGYLNGELAARKELGIALLKTGEEQQGLEILLELVEEFEARERWRDLMKIHWEIAALYERREQYTDAMVHLENFRRAETRFHDDKREQRLAYMQVEFENQLRAQELELLRRENEIMELQEQATESRRKARWLGGIMLALIMLLLFGLLIRFRVDRRRFRQLSEIDGLTGLFNHRRFHQGAEQALARARAAGEVCTLVAADVDLFKQVNDRYGHRAGDRVLQQLGALLRNRFPPPCLAGRVGGEEFAIFLPGNNRLQARQRIQGLRESLGPIEYDGQLIEVTLSFGLVEARRETRLERLRASADHALYRAKRAGRNQLVDVADLGNR